MTPKYYNLNGIHIAMIGKSGNSAIGKAIILAIKPNYTVRSASDDQNIVDKVNNSAGVWQSAPKTDNPTNPIIPVRDPVERFRSACAQDGVVDVDALLDKLEAGDRPSGTFHYKPTSDYLVAGCALYKFPEHIADIAAALGLSEIPSVNDSESNNIPKPTLTATQLARVEAIYAADSSLRESVLASGQRYTAPSVESTAEAGKSVYDKAVDAFDALPLGKQVLWEGVRAKVSDAVLAGDITKAVEILRTTPAIYAGAKADRDVFLALFS